MSAYNDTIYSARLLEVAHTCPECGGPLRATGNLLHFDLPSRSTWGIEFECPRDKEIFTIHEVSMRPLIESILREHGKT